MATCSGCGGVIGKDCFNPQECEMITRGLAEDALNQPIIEFVDGGILVNGEKYAKVENNDHE